MSEKQRLLHELRVIDLRAELDKRKLDKTGVRAVLIKRLTQYLKDEGQDPESHLFDVQTAEGKTPVKRGRTESAADAEEGLEDVRVEDMIVQDDVGDEDEVDEEANKTAEIHTEEPVKTEPTDDTPTDIPEVQSSRKRELDEEPEAVEAKKPCIEETKQQDGEEVKTELNNTDAEDSINLDIGEDELLNDDTESTTKITKEEGAVESAAEPAGASADTESSAIDRPPHATDDNTTSENADDNDKKEKEDQDTKVDENESKKEEAKDGGTTAARNLWVSGLSGDTRAKDLKQLCSKHGKVIGAKVVTNARTPGSRCYGYVTMASAQDADNCIKNLHRTELHGRMISVEKAKSEASGGGPTSVKRKEEPRRKSDEKNETESKKEGDENGEEKEKTDAEEKTESVRSQSRDKSSAVGVKRGRERSRERRRSPREALSFNKIWKERDRERSRLARDEERRRRQAEAELRERERQQREENKRLANERHKLRLERERIEREKKELLRLERERHKLEREKLELERLELKRAQIRLEEERRKRYEAVSYRKPASPPPPPPYDRDRHKRPPPPSLTRSVFEAPPPPRFELSTAYDRSSDKRDRPDYKRDYNSRHVTASGGKYPSNGTAAESSRPPLLPSSRPKEPARTTYEGRDGRGAAYRSSPPSKTEPRAWTTSSRYQDSAAASSKDYPERSGSWVGASKTYQSSRHAVSATAPAHGWTKPSGGASGTTGDSWQASSGGTSERYGSGYETRTYPSAYQPPPPGAAPYVDRYAPSNTREYRHKY